ncbi:hypothetical protein FE257_005736 [Aspergillus nanangensis]|uniref:Uncharacterized protein n=1 Tax=Aspergillus nanangensis TaxID=2582783 RepID=A0AAD4GVF1_ASPNN|nr:hypothetical protein FE257_005736 [Aspergillus nanangensis]
MSMRRPCLLLICFLAATAAAVPAVGQSQAKEKRAGPLPIPSLQIPFGEKFIGSAATAKPLESKIKGSPQAFNMHQDGGNTGTIDYPAPLGRNLELKTGIQSLHILMWTRSGQLVAGYTKIGLSGLQWGLAAVDDETLELQAEWYPEREGQTLNVAYMELLLDTDEIVVTSKEGQIYVVQLTTEGGINLDLTRMENLTSVLGPGELLMNAMYDTQKNLWFSSGGLRAQGGHGDAEQNSSTFGYIEPDGTVHVQHFQDQMVENGIGLNGTTVFALTGPSGAAANGSRADGYFYAFGPGPGTSITTLWSVAYDAGDTQKPGSYSRGSGATPALLGDQYVAITDNANGQVNLVIYHQTKQTDSPQTVCQVPVFPEGKSNIDIAPLAHKQGDKYGVFLCNDYNAPPLYYLDTGLNGDWNNLTQMEPGVIRIDVAADGSGCEVAWEVPDLRIQSVPVISTNNGLVYGYTQAVGPTKYGKWTWYVVALDWETGEEVWRLRTGAGGTYNDDYQPGAIGPDGGFYQGVIGGIIKVTDGPDE